MLARRTSLVLFGYAILLTFLFHQHDFGINLVIAELVLFAYFGMIGSFNRLTPIFAIILFLTLLSLAFTVITNSTFIYFMHFALLIATVGLLIYPNAKSILSSYILGVSNIVLAQFKMVEQLSASKNKKGFHLGKSIWRRKIYFVPLMIVLIFITLYRNSNPVFNRFFVKFRTAIFDLLDSFFVKIEFSLIFTFFVCLLITAFFIFHNKHEETINADIASNDNMLRAKKKKTIFSGSLALKNEYKAAVFLIACLNLILLLLNLLDIQHVWFNFKWEGQYLKAFVHQGTYLLIASIIIAVGLALYFFRHNLNFFKNNRTLKILTYIWLAQNTILIISVAIRNTYYIKYYALAYGRIGVYIFLLLTLFGLLTVLYKVKSRKSMFYLLRTNSFFILFTLTISACFNWDVIIAKYNFNNADKSFLHLEFLADLSDNALPYLDYDKNEITQIEDIQSTMFSRKTYYISPEDYIRVIQYRKNQFFDKWEKQHWLEWNYAEYRAYQKLKK